MMIKTRVLWFPVLPSIRLTACAVLLSGGQALAASGNWTGNGSDANWSDTANWSSSPIPGTAANETATFNSAINNGWGSAATPILIDASGSISNITFTGAAGNYVIGTATGNALTLYGNNNSKIQIDANYTGTNGTITINSPLSLGINYQILNNSASGGGAGSATFVLNGNITNTAGSVQFGGVNTNTNTFSGTLISPNMNKLDAGTWNFTGAIVNTSAYIDGGLMNLTGTKSGSGNTTIRSGTLAVSGNGAVNNVSVTGNAFASGALNLNGNAQFNTTAFVVSPTSSFTMNINDNASLTIGSGYNNGRIIGDAVANTNAYVYQNGGTVTSVNGLAIGERRTTTSTGISEYHLSSGVLSVGYANIFSNLKGGINMLNNSTFYLNSGTITATADTYLQHDNTIDTVGTPGLTNGRFVVQAGGANFNTNGHTITVSGTLEHDTTVMRDGGLVKNGAGTLLLNNINTYNGNTVVNAGTLTVASTGGLTFVLSSGGVTNQLYGSGGTVNINGVFLIDISAVSGVSSGSWRLVDATNLSLTYGAGFSVSGWQQQDANDWTNGNFNFNQLTGIVSVIPEPSTWTLLLCGLLLGTGLALRKRAGSR